MQVAISGLPILGMWYIYAYIYKSYVKYKIFQSNIDNEYPQIPLNMQGSRKRYIDFLNQKIMYIKGSLKM